MAYRNARDCIATVPTEEAVEPYWQRFSRLKEAQGKSWSQLVRASKNVSLSTLRSFAVPPTDGPSRGRDRYPSADTIADVAKALDVSPDEFPEYRLAIARRALDERAAGNNLASALEALAVFEAGQRLHADQHVGKAPTDRLQRERDALDFEQEAEEEDRRRREASRSSDADEQSEDGQEKRP